MEDLLGLDALREGQPENRGRERIALDVPDSFREYVAPTGPGGTHGMRTVNAIAPAQSQQRAALSRIAELILLSDSRAISEDPTQEDAIRLEGRKRLAIGLGCRVQDVHDIAAAYGEQQWEEMVLEERVSLGLNSVASRDASWDSLESAALRKLFTLVESNQVKTPMELLAVAKAANSANRGKRSPTPPPAQGVPSMTNIGIGFGFVPGNPEGGVLPAGNLGTIQLSLSSRIQQQITAKPRDPLNNDGDTTRVIDNVEMMDIDSIRKAGDAFNEEQEGDREG